jgi:formylglycine-generating enzyme required for sulfatase activity
MLLVSKPDGHAWFYVDERPVNAGEYRQVFADHQQPGADSDPVVMIGYDEARSFAHTRGGRLLRGDEWGSAAATPGFLAPGGDTYEWIESVEGKREVRQRGKAQPRSDKGGKDVTFRVVKDI